jgi:peptide/nickel transport system substrate-binding protein
MIFGEVKIMIYPNLWRALVIVLCMLLSITGLHAETTLRIASPLVAPDSDNPYRALSLPSSISSQVMYDPLVVIGRDGKVAPWLLTAWDSEGSKVWRLTLRQGVTFSNGVPLAADAIVGSVMDMQTPKGRAWTVGSSLANIDRAEALSGDTVSIILKRPDPMFPWRMAIWRLPEPESWKTRKGDPSQPSAANTGPFSMVERGEARLVYDANPYAWNKPAADHLELIHLPDQTARLQAMNADAIDIALQMGTGDRELIESIGGQMFERRTTRVMYMTFTKEHVPESNPVHDVRVRLALNYGVNRQRISELLLDGRGKMQGQLVLPGAPGYVEELKSFPYDPEKAKALLKEAGYEDGLALSIRFAPAGADDMVVYQQAAQDLRQIGVKLDLLNAAVSEMTRMMFAGDFRADMFGNFGRGLDPLGDFRYRSCIGQTGKYPPYFCDKVSLGFVRKAQQATSIEEVDALMQQVTRQEYNNPPGIFLWPGIMVDALSTSVVSADGYGDYYDYIPYHAIKIAD